MVNKTMWTQSRCTLLWAPFAACDKLKRGKKAIVQTDAIS